MKLIICFLLSVLSFQPGFAQYSKSYERLDVNNWDVRFNTSGHHGWEKTAPDQFLSNTYFPKGDSSSPIFGFAPWIAAQDSNGNHYASVVTFLQGNRTDWLAGPIVKDTLPLTDSTRLKYWSSFSKLNQWELNQQKNNEQVSHSIRNWPVFGNNSFDEPKQIYPFIDKDLDGVYEPDFEDHPEMSGHQMLWMIQNDAREKNEMYGRNMTLECRTKGFAFSCADNPLLNNVFFVEYEFINRSSRQYQNLMVGHWVDFDLGYGYDDLIGSDSSIGCFFVYNGDSIDEGPLGYGTNLPIVSATPLSSALSGFMTWYTDFTIYGSPITPKDFYDRLNSRWKTGVPLREREFTRRSGRPTKFMYEGNLLDTAEWTELSDGNQPADRRGLGSTGPFTLNPGDTLKSLWAFTFHRAASGTREDAYRLMLKEVPEIKKLYAQTGLHSPCKSAIGVNVGETVESGISFYPNPAKNFVQIESDQPIDLIMILSIDGRILRVVESNRNTVDISSLHSGLYLLEVSTPLGKSVHRLVIE